jgi:hypothetical protein
MARLLDEKERLEVQIAKQRRKVAAWQALASEEGERDNADSDSQFAAEIIFKEEGLSDACRTVMRSSTMEWMTTADIQSGLRQIGFPLENYKAPHASITTTINRMAGPDGEVVANRSSNPGATLYKWVGPKYGAPNSLANQTAEGRLTESLELWKRMQQKKPSGK